MIKLEKYVPLDNDGYLRNDLSFDLIPEDLKAMINLLKNTILSQDDFENIHSLYVRGSIARGEFYFPHSDIDLIVLFYQDASIGNLKRELSTVILKEYQKQIKVDIYGMDYQALPQNTQFSLKVNAICFYGNDVSPQIQKFKPDNSICFLKHSFEQDVKTAKADLYLLQKSDNDSDKQLIRKIYGWIAKRILRVGLELTLPTSGQYSRDLNSCYLAFSKLFPSYSQPMLLILTLYIDRCEDVNRLIHAIDAVNNFLIKACK